MPTTDPRTALAGKDLKQCDLSRADLSDRVLFHTDLRGCNLHGCKISLDCQTFDKVKLDDEQVACLLLMLQKADMHPAWSEGLRVLVANIVGAAAYKRLQRFTRMVERRDDDG